MKKKQIAFIEMETHSALLEQWYLLVKAMNLIDFHFFVSQKVFDKLTTIPTADLTVIEFVSTTNFSAFDSVVVNTLHRNFEDYKKLFAEKPTLCLVHNLNFSLLLKSISWKNMFKEKEKFTYLLKLYVKERVGSKRKVLHEAKYFGVIAASALKTIQNDGRFSDKSQLIQLNYCQNSEFPSEETIQIVMPGNVSNKRKDVDLLFEILPKLQPNAKIHFTFLGKPENEMILHQLESLKTQCHSNVSITHFHQFIPWSDYSTIIAQAHVLLCPIKQATSFYWVDEVYGQTKVSGAEADCMYNGKIGIFPETYPKMDWHNLYYEDEAQLSLILNELTIEKLQLEYTHLQEHVQKYTFESVKNKLEVQLIELTQN